MKTKKTSIKDAVLFSLVGIMLITPCLMLVHQDKSGHLTVINLAGLLYTIALVAVCKAAQKWYDGH